MKIKNFLSVLLALLFLLGTVPVFAVSANESTYSAVASSATRLELTIYGKNLALEDSVYISYAVPVSGTEGADSVTMLFWLEPQSEYTYGTQAYELSPEPQLSTINGVKCYVFNFNKLAAKQMTVDVYAMHTTCLVKRLLRFLPNKCKSF